jgi:hypothetical protein
MAIPGFENSSNRRKEVLDFLSVAGNKCHQVSGCAGVRHGRQSSESQGGSMGNDGSLGCHRKEACDEPDETMRVLRTTHGHDWMLLGQHGMSIAGDRVAVSIR